MKKNTVITISRQYGSGGRQISRLLSEKMGVKRYDRTVVAMAAESLGAGDRLEDVLSRSSGQSVQPNSTQFPRIIRSTRNRRILFVRLLPREMGRCSLVDALRSSLQGSRRSIPFSSVRMMRSVQGVPVHIMAV